MNIIGLMVLFIASMFSPQALGVDAQWYADNVPEGHWVEISNNQPMDLNPCPGDNCSYSRNSGVRGVLIAWTGAAFADNFGNLGSYIIGPGGGHGAYDGDEIYIFDLETQNWTRPYDPTDPTGPYDAANGESRNDRPVASHTYSLQGWDPEYGGPSGALIQFTAGPNGDAGGSPLRTHAYPLDRNDGTWDRLDHFASPGTGGSATYDSARGRFFIQNAYLPTTASTQDVNAPSGQQLSQFNNKVQAIDHSAAYDPTRDIVVTTDFRSSSNPGVFYTDMTTAERVKVSTSGNPGGVEGSTGQKMGLEYVPPLDAFVAYVGRGRSATYMLKPPADIRNGTWQWTQLDALGGVTPQAMVNTDYYGRVYTRWQWVNELNLFLLIQRMDGPVYAYRPPGVLPPNAAPRPTVQLSSSSNTVLPGGTAQLTWTASNANSCVASGAWSGDKPLEGSETVGPLTATSSYILTCTNAEGPRSASVTVTVQQPTNYTIEQSSSIDHNDSFVLDGTTVSGRIFAYVVPDDDVSGASFYIDNTAATGTPDDSESVAPFDFFYTGEGGVLGYDTSLLSNGSHTITARLDVPGSEDVITTVTFNVDNEAIVPAPSISFNASPVEVEYGGFSSLSWQTSNAATCTAAGTSDWDGDRATSGSQSVGPLFENTSFFLGCEGPGGTTDQTISVSVAAPEPPQLTFSASASSIDFNDSVTLTWSTTNALLCIASGDWAGSRPATGSESLGPLQSSSSFTLSCSGAGGDVTRTVNVDVAAIPAPVITFSASPETVAFNGSSLLEWQTDFADSCTASGDWTGARSVDGSFNAGPLTQNSTFTLTCEGLGGTNTATANVTVGAAPAPTLNFNVSEAQVPFGGSSVAVWETQNVTGCSASGDWTGPRGPNGFEAFGGLESNLTLTLFCIGPGGTVSDTKTILVDAPLAPIVTLTATPSAVDFGGGAQLNWSVENAESCVASGDWSGARGLTGSETVGPLNSDSTFTLTCQGAGGTGADTASITVASPPPTLNLGAAPTSLGFGETSTLVWISSNATECVASGDWSGNKNTDGAEVSPVLTADSTFVLTCTGPGGEVTDSVSVTVAAVGATSVSLIATPAQVAPGGTTSLSWTSQNANSCVASGDWSGALAVSGEQLVGPLNSDSTFTLTCSGDSGDASQTLVVPIDMPAPTIELTAAPSTVDYDGSTTLTWSATNANSCEAFGGWSGAQALQGSRLITNLTENKTFVLFCEGDGGSSSQLVDVIVTPPPAPQITFTSDTNEVIYGGSVQLTWSVDNAETCEAFGGWSGSRELTGTASVGPVNGEQQYNLVCAGAGGQSDATVVVNVITTEPTLVLSASTASVLFGESVTLTWESTATSSCRAFGSWTGEKASSGSQTITDLQSDAEFFMLCAGPGGEINDSVSVAVSAAPIPSVTFTVAPSEIEYGGSTVLSWTSENADSCEAYGGWTGVQATEGSLNIDELFATTSFTLLCEGPGGNRVVTRTVDVALAPAPQIIFEIDPSFISYGGSAQLSWSVEFATSCLASAGWSGEKLFSGSESVGALFGPTNFTLTCTGIGGSNSASVSANVASVADMPLQNFEEDGFNTDPVGWIDTAQNFSNIQLPAAFKVRDVAGTQALTVIRNDGLNLHSHYVLNGANTWQDYRYTGRIRFDDLIDKVGVTVLSNMPTHANSNADYYRLGIDLSTSEFVLSNQGSAACSGDMGTGVQPQPGSWYRFSIETESTGANTQVRARVWADGTSEPGSWQAECVDTGPGRLIHGAPGVWVTVLDSVAGGAWDELAVVPLTAPVAPKPVISFTANPVTVADQGQSTLLWSVQNADTCTASGDWSGDQATQGNFQTDPLSENGVYTLTCQGPGGSTASTVLVTIGDAVPPTLTFTASPSSISAGDDVVLNWSATDALRCSASGDWAGFRPPVGMSAEFTNVQNDLVLTLDCSGNGGEVSQTLKIVLADTIREPQLDFDVVPLSLGVDGTVALAWRSENTTECTASGSWSGSVETTDYQVVGPIEVSATYTITCSGLGGTVTDSIEVSYVDTDGDGMPDVWEQFIFGSLDNNGTGDTDGDGLTDQQEYIYGTDPLVADTDGDGQTDADEVQFGSDPRNPLDNFGDSSPQRPQLADDSNVGLMSYQMSAVNGYLDPDGNALSYSQWQIATDADFESIVFQRDISGSISLTVPLGVLDPGVTYFARTRHFDTSGAPSMWSEGATLVADTAYPNDLDGDGINDDYQVTADADTDGNGVSDSSEGICNLLDAEGGNVIGITSNSGVIRCYTAIPNTAITSELPIADSELPLGMFTFRVEGLFSTVESPASVFISIWLPEDYDPESGWVKYDEATGEVTDYSENVTFNGNRATLRLVDGGIGDQDGVVNGVIVDPSGPAIMQAAPTTPQPPDTTPPTTTPPSNPISNDSGGGGALHGLVLLMLGVIGWRRRRFA